MTNSQIFTEAHRMTREIRKSSDSYSVTFGACLRFIYANLKNKKDMIKKVEVIDAYWSGDEKSIHFSIKASCKRHTVLVGNEVWENEDEDTCKNIIEKELGVIISNELIIE